MDLIKRNEIEFAIQIIKTCKKGILAYPYENIPRNKIELYLDAKIERLNKEKGLV